MRQQEWSRLMQQTAYSPSYDAITVALPTLISSQVARWIARQLAFMNISTVFLATNAAKQEVWTTPSGGARWSLMQRSVVLSGP